MTNRGNHGNHSEHLGAVAWPNDVVPRAQYRDVELLTTFPDVILCGSADARVHLRVHAASEGGGDHRPPQVRVGNRRI